MKMIEAIYEELKTLGAVNSRTRFSEDWLGMEGSYFRGRRTKDLPKSPRALATCAARLKGKSQLLQISSLPEVRRIAQRMDRLAQRCVDELLAACEN